MNSSFFRHHSFHGRLTKIKFLSVLAILPLCAVLSSCSGTVSAGNSGSPGTSGQPAISLSANSLTFGNQTVGTQSSAQTVTITNVSTVMVNFTSIVSSGDFAETNTCATSLNVGANCTISVTFTPTTTGSLSGSVTITDNATGSPQSISLSGTGTSASQPAISLSTNSLIFGNQTVGAQSNPQVVTVTNTSTVMVNFTSIAASGDFAETNTCAASLNAGAKCTISVTFTPETTGSLSGSVSITDNATGSPQSVSLSGTGVTSGGGGGSTVCTGTPLTQDQTNVTSQLSYVNTAAGVQVEQITDNATNRFYYFDVPAYSSVVNQMLYVNFVTNAGNNMVTANPDGTNAQIISASSTGEQGFITGDGTLAYYDKPVLGGTPGGVDIFGVFLNATGSCKELRFTNLDVKPQSPLPVWEISPSSPDPAGGVDIAFSPDTLLHRVHVQTDGTSQILPTFTLNDPESADTFHRLRMNPKFPNIVLYKRNQSGGTAATVELWLVDLNTCANSSCSAAQITNLVANLPTKNGETPKGDHLSWSPDGLHIAFLEPDIGDFWFAANVVNANGTLNPNFTLTELGPFTSPQTTADYCVFPPTWPTATILACVAGPASMSHPGTYYLMSSDGKGTMKLLAASDAQILTINGTPMMQFVQDDQHLVTNSDRTGTPQVYNVSGFTLSVP
jgi:hypothetical protein